VSCTTDQECIDSTGVADDKCGVPDCTANDAIKKEATAFGFLPAGCSGTACTGVRALVFGIKASTANKLIPDGSVLYTCNVAISATAEDGTYPLTISNVVMSYPSPPGGQIPGAAGDSGSVVVGVPPGPTNTPAEQPTNTPVVEATNTPTVTPVPVLPTATATAAATRTATPSATPSSGVVPVCPTCEDDDGCQIGASGHGPAWLLLIPAIGLLAMRRRRG
jgi:MYXO-CTERM domain-containing protein